MNESGNNSNDNAQGNGHDTSAEGPQRLSDTPDEAAQTGAANEAEKFKNEYLYLRAEFDNFKRQMIKEQSDLRKYGAQRLAVDLLNVLDIFETALAAEVNPENVANFKKGIEMTANELRSVLGRHGVEEVPAAGKPFDPSVHEALTSEETEEVSPGTVTRVFKKPYKLHDRVIRHGQVVVAKSKS